MVTSHCYLAQGRHHGGEHQAKEIAFLTPAGKWEGVFRSKLEQKWNSQQNVRKGSHLTGPQSQTNKNKGVAAFHLHINKSIYPSHGCTSLKVQ